MSAHNDKANPNWDEFGFLWRSLGTGEDIPVRCVEAWPHR
jgi:hypothetical protein